MERLIRFLNALGSDVEIVVRAPTSARGEARVSVPQSRPAWYDCGTVSRIDKGTERIAMRRLGKQKPRFSFFLNPYSDLRFTRCPKCQGKTRQRKLPLLIHIDPIQLFALNKTCRYCPLCDLLIAHQDEIEGYLAAFFTQNKPAVIGNDYLVIGTLDRLDWQKGVDSSVSVREMLDRMHDFRDVLKVELTGGWMPDEAKSLPKGHR